MKSTLSRPLALLICALLLPTVGCDGDPGAALDAGPPDAETGALTRAEVLGQLATAVFVPAMNDFAARSAALLEAADGWSAAGGGEGAELDAAREAWRGAMAAWQYNELLLAGPAGAESSFIGGQGLRDRIYSWPTTRPCGVDQNIVTERYAQADFFSTQLVNVFGLDALEYLLFHTGPDNDCPSQVAINADGTWAALQADELNRRRATYAAVVAGGIAAEAESLRAAWEPTEDDFAGQLAGAGAEGSPYGSAREALEQVFHGMFYLDKVTKDLKLAVPTGLSPDCPSAQGCPADLEARWAGFARESLAANLKAGRALFTGGGAGPGFADLLVQAGAADLAEQMQADFDAAVAALQDDATPLDRLIADDLDAAQALHARVKAITDALKSRFVSVLDLAVPASGAADND